MTSSDYTGSTVVITGGATGIGFALAKQFGRLGAKIVIGEPRQNRLDEAISKLRAEGVEAAATELDVADRESVKAFADFAWRQGRPVTVVINNAGVGMSLRGMLRQDVRDVRKLFDVNFFGVWHGCATFGERLVEQGLPASIYNVGSENSFFNAAPKMAAYIASKHAVRGLTEALRDELPDFINVGLICPGFVKSELTPGPFGDYAMDADRFAEIVVKQIREGAFYVVSHAYNIERIKPVHEEIETAYAINAPRYDGDDEYDVRHLMARFAKS